MPTLRRLLPLLLLALTLGACQSADDAPTEAPVEGAASAEPAATTYGAEVDAAQALPAEAVLAEADRYAGQPVTVEGRVVEVCQKKGCWLTLDAGEGRGIRILTARTPEGGYVYTVPKDISGRRAVVHGTLKAETMSADEQRHLAEDAGEDVSERTFEDRAVLQIMAEGVRVTGAPAADAPAPTRRRSDDA